VVVTVVVARCVADGEFFDIVTFKLFVPSVNERESVSIADRLRVGGGVIVTVKLKSEVSDSVRVPVAVSDREAVRA